MAPSSQPEAISFPEITYHDQQATGLPIQEYGLSNDQNHQYHDPYDSKERPISTIPESESMLNNGRPARPSISKRTKFWDTVTSVPFLGILVQTILLLFLWVFFAITFRDPISLPQRLAIKVKLNEQAVLFVVSLIASTIGFVSTSLFTGAIAYAVSLFLSGPQPIALYKVSAIVQLLSESPVMSFRKWGWSIVTGGLVCLIGAQTASWTTLLTPKNIPVKAALQGFELDLSSPAFSRLMTTNQEIVTPELFANSISLVTQSGTTAVSTQLSWPSILNFNQLSYINSTGGTLPAAWRSWPSTSTSAAGTVIPAGLNFTDLDSHINPANRSLFPISFSMTQQGFTSRVECRSVPLTPTSRPSVTITQSTQSVGAGLNVSVSSVTVECNGDGHTILNYDGTGTGATQGPTKRGEAVLTNSARDAVFASSCAVAEADGKPHWDIILVGDGRYSFMGSSICSIWPMTTSADVDYQDSSALFNSSYPSFINGTREWKEKASPWLGQFVVDIFLRGVVGQGQSTRGSALGDVVRGFVGGTGQPNPEQVPKVLEAYTRGVMEFSATLLRSAYSSSDNHLFANAESAIPEDMRIPMNGTYHTETMGWYQETSRGAAASTLISPTVIGFGTILLIIVSKWWTSRTAWRYAGGNRRPITPAEDTAFSSFDVSNLMHVIKAAQAGGLVGVDFPDYDDDMEEWSERVGVRLGKVGKDVGFVVG